MNTVLSHQSIRWLMLFVLSLACVPLFTSIAFAASVTLDATTIAIPVLQANLVYEFASDRGRMIQISLVFVAVGCALIWWYR